MCMPSATMKLAAKRSPPDSPEFQGRPAQCEVELTVDGQSLSNSFVSVSFDNSSFIHTTQLSFHRFCELVTGKPARLWRDIAGQIEGLILSPSLPTPLSTVEQNVLKACFLTYLW